MNVSDLFPQGNQLWLDYMAYPVVDIDWDYELNVGYNRLLSEAGWSDIYLNNTVTFQKLLWLLFDGSLELHYTHDPEYFNSAEVRPWVMTTARWMTEGEYINLYRPYFQILVESRNLFYEDEELNQQTFRMRLRAGTKITLNKDKMTSGTLFFHFRGDYFIDIGKSVTEKFASKHRIMFGLGYIFNSAVRAELYYYINSSRNTYEDEFNRTDDIYSLIVRHYF
jgi:hypothetical protein